MTVIDDLLRVYVEGYNAGFAAGRASVLGGAHREGESDGPGGVSWEKVARFAEANQDRLSSWEKELIDSVLCSLFYGVALTERQKMKLAWIFFNRFNGRIS